MSEGFTTGLQLDDGQVKRLHTALDAVELMTSDVAQSVSDQRSIEARRYLFELASREPELKTTVHVSVIATALVYGLTEIAAAIRSPGSRRSPRAGQCSKRKADKAS